MVSWKVPVVKARVMCSPFLSCNPETWPHQLPFRSSPEQLHDALRCLSLSPQVGKWLKRLLQKWPQFCQPESRGLRIVRIPIRLFHVFNNYLVNLDKFLKGKKQSLIKALFKSPRWIFKIRVIQFLIETNQSNQRIIKFPPQFANFLVTCLSFFKPIVL